MFRARCHAYPARRERITRDETLPGSTGAGRWSPSCGIHRDDVHQRVDGHGPHGIHRHPHWAIVVDRSVSWYLIPALQHAPKLAYPVSIGTHLPPVREFRQAERAAAGDRQPSARSAGTSSASARPRCEAASFSAGVSSAAERAEPSGTKIGS